MKLLYTTTLLLFGIALSGQYNYGLEVEQQDAKIEGKLSLDSGNRNLFIGQNAGISITNGDSNNFIGGNSGIANTTGDDNTFIGHNSGFSNTSANNNCFFGSYSGYSTSSGSFNSYYGRGSGSANTIGNSNSFFGYNSGTQNITGIANSFFGARSGFSNTGNSNSFFGAGAGTKNTTARDNSFFGASAGSSNTTGSDNTFIGTLAGQRNIDGQANSFLGRGSGFSHTTGSKNSFFGAASGYAINSGSNNSFFGNAAGVYITGSNNIVIGRGAGPAQSNSSQNNKLYIDVITSSSPGNDTPLIYGEFDNDRAGINWDSSVPLPATFAVNGTASKTAAGDWLANSDARLKKNIEYLSSKSMLDKVTQMKAVRYEWNDNTTGYDRPKGQQYGFIAQDLQQVWPDNVIEDAQGYLQTSYGTYDHMYVEAIKELDKKYEKIEQENQMLKDELKAIKEILETMVSN